MQQNNNINSDDLDNISVNEIIDILINEKLKLFSITTLTLIVSIIYSLYIPNQYVSYSVLAPVSDLSNSAKIPSQYSGVASLAGISLPASGSEKTYEAIEVMKSLDFFTKFLNKYNLEIPIIAANGWERNTNKLKINKKIYDTKNKKWVSNIKFSVNGKPSTQYAHKIFLENLLIDIDKKTDFITVSYKHFSPNTAKDIVDLMLMEINTIIKNDDLKHAELSISFLKTELKNTKIQGIKESLNRLVEANYETIVLANSSPEYLFKTLSASFAPEKKSSPERAYIVIAATFISFFLSSMYLLANFYLRNRKN